MADSRRVALFIARYLDCNPFRYRSDACYSPLGVVLTYARNRVRFRAVACPYKVIWVDPRSIAWNLAVPAKRWPIGLVLAGDWDVRYRRPVDIAWKIPSMHQRFVEGRDWVDTELFRRVYAPRFEESGGVRNAESLAALADHYSRVYDRLFEVIRERGFRTPSLGDPDISFMYVHIGRAGEFMYTRGGNHRLGIALALGVTSMPVRVVTRHRAWQSVREEVRSGRRPRGIDLDHPDLQDLVRLGS